LAARAFRKKLFADDSSVTESRSRTERQKLFKTRQKELLSTAPGTNAKVVQKS
jgi:hypothetical protein